ncbi:NAD(P)-dependent oxidoreductase [Hydrogenophaga sp. OTU3427]|uniref:NAD(P)-dependent oxidoreductase n=1 Tax=Hydrogenophaga sp. OTU3427 TaxID=3043856 RepID=UPI00313C907D
MSASVQVGLVGAGNMGGAMLARLRECGWLVAMHDIAAARCDEAQALGARVCANAAEVARGLASDGVLIVAVVDAAQTEDVLFGRSGALTGLRAGQTVLLCPTIAPDTVERCAARLAERGVFTLDAPMSGGPARARDGSMSLMLAGPQAVLARHVALLADLSSRRFVVSERVGDGARTKLVNNLLAGINLVGAAEALALAGRLGLDLSTTLDVIEQSSGQSWIGSDRMRRAIAGDLAPRAHVTLLEKDTGLAVAAGQAVGFEGPLGARAAAVFRAAHQAGLAEFDDAALFQLLRGPDRAA